jgi:hypothetical protein
LDHPGERGVISPESSAINCSVPSRHNVYVETYNELLLPGVLDGNINTLSEHMGIKIVKLVVDGKQISRGKEKMVDVDCWGHETSLNLLDRISRLQ